MIDWVIEWWLGLGKSRIFRTLQWVAAFGDQELRVVSCGLLPVRLLVDGTCVDKRSPLLPTNRTIPLLSTRLKSPKNVVVIAEVYVMGTIVRDVEIRINGKLIPRSLILESIDG